MDNNLIASSSPHLRSNETISRVMLDVLIALLPAAIGSIWFFGLDAVILISLAIGAAVISEWICQRVMNRPVSINDLSAAVTGLLVAFNIPPTAPWWIPVIGSAFAIIIVKQLFGGLGHNFMNPALAARAMLLASWPVTMTNWIQPGTQVSADAVSSATTLAILSGDSKAALPSLTDVFFGNVAGCLGETSAFLLIIGGIYLLYRGVINWRIPFTYIATVAVFTLVFGEAFAVDLDPTRMIYHILAGGLMLGAFYMATDYSSSPISARGQVIFGIGCGLITIVIRLQGGYPEGVSYAILLMNLAAPLIDKYTKPKVFGEVK